MELVLKRNVTYSLSNDIKVWCPFLYPVKDNELGTYLF